MPPHGSLPDEAVAAIMAYAYTTPPAEPLKTPSTVTQLRTAASEGKSSKTPPEPLG